ncbi:MAG: hypothetical protein Q8P50_08385, partial [Bacillota bacterium]|nr:hypothetical protein [Bacillota bacterium]
MPANENKASELLVEAQKYLELKQYQEALRTYEKAFKIAPVAPVACSLALAQEMVGNHKGVLKTLARFIRSEAVLPQGRALASVAYSSLGDRKRAADMARRATSDLEAGLKSPALREGVEESAWLTDAPIVKRALGYAGLHEALLNLHSRLPGSVDSLGALYAGIAAFNLRRFERAKEIWEAISNPDLDFVNPGWTAVAEMAARGLVPPFELSYEMPPEDADTEASSDAGVLDPAQAEDAGDPMPSPFVMFSLYLVFRTLEFGRQALLSSMVYSGGDWGERLARKVLSSDELVPSLKMAAIDGLLAAGRLEVDQKVILIHNGRQVSIEAGVSTYVEQDPVYEARLREARSLNGKGQHLEALEALRNLPEPGQEYVPARLEIVKLLLKIDRWAEAAEEVSMLEDELPGDLRVRRLATAAGNRAPQTHGADEPFTWGQEDDFQFADEEPVITTGITLKAALKQMGFRRINDFCLAHGLPVTERRPIKEQAFVATVTDPDRLKEVLRAERPAVLDAAQSMLRSGGWAHLRTLEKKFGPLRDEAMLAIWRPSATTLGRLQHLGLMYTGRLFASTERGTVAVIPVDLREPLEVALAALGRGKKRSEPGRTLPLPGTEQVPYQANTPKPVAVRLRVSLKGVSPPIWRRLLVPSDITLHGLHQVIQRAASWTDSHLYEFRIGGQRYGVPDPDSGWYGMEYIRSKKTLLKDVARPGKRFTYLYDFGDSWEHEVFVEDIEVVSEPLTHAECTDGKRAFPPEDCGGTPGYHDLLRALRDPDDPSHQEMLDWAGNFDPEYFNKAEVNASLRRLGLGKRTRRQDFRIAGPGSGTGSEPGSDSGTAPAGGPGSVLDISGYPGHGEFSRLLAETGSNVPLHKVRTLMLGAVAASKMPSMRYVIPAAWGGRDPEFASMDQTREVMGCFMSLWNLVAESQDGSFRLAAVEPVRSTADIVKRAAIRKDEISGFTRGLDLGDTDPDKMSEAAVSALKSMAEASAFLEQYIRVSAKDKNPKAKVLRETSELFQQV